MLNNYEHVLSKLLKLENSEKSIVINQCIKEMCLTDFFFFTKHILGYKDLEWDVHKECIKALESDAKRKLVCMPRGSFKSTLASVAYPIWCLLKNPNETILLDSELYTNSKNLLREIKGHLESAKFMSIFGNHVGPTWGEGEIIIKTRTKNSKEASITVGGIGTTKVGQHYSKIIADDYNSASNSDTAEKCQKVLDHFRYNLNILNPGGEYVIVGTRYAELDVIGFLLSNVLEEKHLSEGKLIRGSPKPNDGQGLVGSF